MGEVGCCGILLCICFLGILVGSVVGMVGDIDYMEGGKIID